MKRYAGLETTKTFLESSRTTLSNKVAIIQQSSDWNVSQLKKEPFSSSAAAAIPITQQLLGTEAATLGQTQASPPLESALLRSWLQFF